MGKQSKELICTAYHEAGHAVAAYFQNVRVKRVTIRPEDTSLGRTYHGVLEKAAYTAMEVGGMTPRKRANIEAHLIITLAGQVAEKRHRGRYNHIGASSDNSKLTDFVLSMSGSEEEASAYLKWLHCRTVNLVTRYWWAVEKVAQALLEATTLTGDAVGQVIRDEADARLAAHMAKMSKVE